MVGGFLVGHYFIVPASQVVDGACRSGVMASGMGYKVIVMYLNWEHVLGTMRYEGRQRM